MEGDLNRDEENTKKGIKQNLDLSLGIGIFRDFNQKFTSHFSATEELGRDSV